MAIARVKNTQAVRRLVGSRFKVAITKMLRSKELRLKVGRIVEEDIRKNFRKSVTSKATLAFRKYYEKYNPTHPDYNRRIINITFTGDLLEDLAKNVKADTNKLELIVEHSDKKHKLYKLRKRKGGRKRHSHKEISEFVISKGYDYLQITDKASAKIRKLVQEELFALLKQQFK